jgi:hypothetical protein
MHRTLLIKLKKIAKQRITTALATAISTTTSPPPPHRHKPAAHHRPWCSIKDDGCGSEERIDV